MSDRVPLDIEKIREEINNCPYSEKAKRFLFFIIENFYRTEMGRYVIKIKKDKKKHVINNISIDKEGGLGIIKVTFHSPFGLTHFTFHDLYIQYKEDIYKYVLIYLVKETLMNFDKLIENPIKNRDVSILDIGEK
jgi:glutaredoxin